MANIRRVLSLYAEHAGISKEGARKRLARLGIDYSKPFDFADADRRHEAASHADRAVFSNTNYGDLADDEPVDPETRKHPTFIESQARREMFKANLTELEYFEQVGKLIPVEEVDREWFRIGRLVRDTMKNIGPRLRAQLASESDPFRCEQLLDDEIERALEVLNERIVKLEEVA